MSTQDQKSSSSTQTSCATQVPLEETPTKRVQRDPSDCDANILRNTKSEKPAGSTAAPPTPTRHQVDHPAPAKISDKATEKQANKQANENLITPDENYISTFWDGAEELWHNLDTMDRASLLAKYPHLEGLINEQFDEPKPQGYTMTQDMWDELEGRGKYAIDEDDEDDEDE